MQCGFICVTEMNFICKNLKKSENITFINSNRLQFFSDHAMDKSRIVKYSDWDFYIQLTLSLIRIPREKRFCSNYREIQLVEIRIRERQLYKKRLLKN